MAQEKETAENAWPVLSKKIFLDTRIPLKIQSRGDKAMKCLLFNFF